MTATVSATCAITDSWCEMKIIVSPRRSVQLASRLRICAWTETSSALTASSAISSSGCGASARAIATRWRWPPDSSRGKRRATAGGRPTSSSSSATLAAALVAAGEAVHAQRLADRRADGQARVQRRERVLEDHLDPAP